MFIKIIIFLIILIIEIYSKKFILTKNPDENIDYSPYIFNFTLNNELILYPSIFDTSRLYIIVYEENEILKNSKEKNSLVDKNITINNKTFKYKITTDINHKDYIGTIGLANKDKDKYKYKEGSNDNYNDFSYLCMLEAEEENITKFINFIQSDEYNAVMIFGDIDSRFNQSNWSKCKCSEIYWGCQISSVKIGGSELYTPTSGMEELGIISISEEYIIAPKDPGDKIMTKYKNKIKDIFDIECINILKNESMVHLRCDYFNYEYLPDLSFIMEGGVGIMVISIDLFKIAENHTLEFKIIYDNKTKDENKWYLGEPVVKNYNFILNYTDKDNIELIIIPASLNGFILIIVACLGGFVFLLIFITCIYCINKNNQEDNIVINKYNRYNNEKIYQAINSIDLKIQEKEDEIKKNEDNEKDINKYERKIYSVKLEKDNFIQNNNNINNIIINTNEEHDDEEIITSKDNYMETSSLINNSDRNNNLRINENKNDNDNINNNNIDNSNKVNVELSINNYENDDNENDEDEKDFYINQKKPKNE